MEAYTEFVVAQDGSGDFTVIQDAINAVPEENAGRTTIRIRNGVYREKLYIAKRAVSLLGESAEHTVIVYGDYANKRFPDGELYHTFNSYTAFIGGEDFTAEHISLVNDAGPGEQAGQALAAYVDGDRAVFRNCRFIGHQDTLFTGPLPEQPIDRSTFGGPREGQNRRASRQYYENCYIEGDVDFIFGSATAVFNRCEIFAKDRPAAGTGTHGWLTAASTPRDAEHGYVFIACKLTGDAPAGSYYLGRPWREHAKTAFISCWLGSHIHAAGWGDWNGRGMSGTVTYSEFGGTGPGAADVSQRTDWSRQLDEKAARRLTPELVLAGNDGWSPLVNSE